MTLKAFPLHLILALFLLFPLCGNAQTFEQDVQGLPLHFGKEIAKSQYVPVITQRLVSAKVVWVNQKLMQEKGYTVDDQSILNAWAWAVPSADDNPQTFTRNRKVFYATRYGGSRIGINQGDGRAATAGAYQVKGIGRTPLAKQKGYDHANGKVSLEEAMREAFWGEVNNAELPYGGNRVLAILDRGTSTQQRNGQIVRDALIIREDPVRPAHFLSLPISFDEETGLTTYKGISQESMDILLGVLPYDTEPKKIAQEKLVQGLTTLIRRLARQHATAFARGIYHGASSPSNMEISGRFLDYGTETAQPGHGKVKMISDHAVAGDNSEIKESAIDEFSKEILARVFSQRKTNKILQILRDEFDDDYRSTLRIEFLERLGIDHDVFEKLGNSDEANDLADVLIKIATIGGKRYVGKYSVPDRVTKYDFVNVVIALTAPKSLNVVDILSSLKNVEPDLSRAKNLANSFVRFQKKAAGISPINYLEQVYARALEINQPRILAYRWLAMNRNFKVIDEYLASGDVSLIQNEIDGSIASSLRNTNTPRLLLKLSCSSLFENE